jgi:mannosyl-oligosaccharide glucosidase
LKSPSQDDLDAVIQKAYEDYDTRFEKIFGLAEKGFSKPRIEFAQYALSNLLGGIG